MGIFTPSWWFHLYKFRTIAPKQFVHPTSYYLLIRYTITKFWIIQLIQALDIDQNQKGQLVGFWNSG